MTDICPIMSIGKDETVHCNPYCAWFDTDLKECAVSRINANLKSMEDLRVSNEGVVTAINQLDDNISKGFEYLVKNS